VTEAVPDTTSGSCYVTIEVNPVSGYKAVHYFDYQCVRELHDKCVILVTSF